MKYTKPTLEQCQEATSELNQGDTMKVERIMKIARVPKNRWGSQTTVQDLTPVQQYWICVALGIIDE